MREPLEQTPAHCSVTGDRYDFVIAASTQDPLGVWRWGSVAVFWNGVISVFFMLLVRTWWDLLVGPLPAWIPAPNWAGGPAGVGLALFFTVFLIPFLCIGAFTAWLTLLSMAGVVEVRIRNGQGVVRTRVGPLGLRRRFDVDQVRGVSISETKWEYGNEGRERKLPLISLRADREIRFGIMLPEERMKWLVATIHRALIIGEDVAR